MRMIAACSKNGVIGVDNTIPWKDKEDMKRFKSLTTGNTVIMGRNTYESMGRLLPNRQNVIISSSLKVEGAECSTLHDAINKYKDTDAWVIGGETIYTQMMPYCNEIDLTIMPMMIDLVPGPKKIIRMPWINPLEWDISKTYTRGDGVFIYNYKRVK